MAAKNKTLSKASRLKIAESMRKAWKNRKAAKKAAAAVQDATSPHERPQAARMVTGFNETEAEIKDLIARKVGIKELRLIAATRAVDLKSYINQNADKVDQINATTLISLQLMGLLRGREKDGIKGDRVIALQRLCNALIP